MFCCFCGSLNAHHEVVSCEVDCGRHQFSEDDLEVVFCPDCARIQLEAEAAEKLSDWLASLGEDAPTQSRYQLPDGTILVDHDDEEEDPFEEEY